MIEIILDSGTTWVVPLDWDNANNSIECFGPGAAGGGNVFGKNTTNCAGGGAGAYARGDSITLTPGSTIQVRIGAGGIGSSSASRPTAAGGDTCFNATSLADAVSNGDAVSVAAPGGSGATGGVTGATAIGGVGGVGTSGVGNHTRTSGENGGNGTGGTGNSGRGGNCPNGGTGGASITVNNTPGNPGNAPGGGGSGARGGGTRAGGDGANGRIVINYTPIALSSGHHRMFLVFSHAATWLLAGWVSVLNIFTHKEQAA